MDPSSITTSPSYGKALDTYKKALATAASVTAYVVLARSMARELLPNEVCTALRWGVSFVCSRFGRAAKERHTIVIRRHDDGFNENQLYEAARTYLASRINPRTMRRVSIARPRTKDADGGAGGRNTLLCMEPGSSMADVFDGVEFQWTSIETAAAGGDEMNRKINRYAGNRVAVLESLELGFDAEHADLALEKYVPYIVATAEQTTRRERALKIFLNESTSWRGINHHHPATFETLAMDPGLKKSIIDDLDRFLKRREYYMRIGKAWKRGYLLYGPPGTGKSSLVAAMANYLRFNLYDLDLSEVRYNSALQRLLVTMPSKSILVIEDIDCCFDSKSREAGNERKVPKQLGDGDDGCSSDSSDDPIGLRKTYSPPVSGANVYSSIQGGLQQPPPPSQQQITLSGLLNVIDGLWSTCGEERIMVFTTNYKERLDPALLRPGRMDMHIYMGYCTWDAFKTLAWNYHLVDGHPLFPEIQGLLLEVEVTPAEASEMLLRSEDAGIALGMLTEFLRKKRERRIKQRQNQKTKKQH